MTTFTIIVHHEPTGGFRAEVPALPGCYFQADTLENLLSNLKEAIQGTLEVMKEEGEKPETDLQIMELAV